MTSVGLPLDGYDARFFDEHEHPIEPNKNGDKWLTPREIKEGRVRGKDIARVLNACVDFKHLGGARGYKDIHGHNHLSTVRAGAFLAALPERTLAETMVWFTSAEAKKQPDNGNRIAQLARALFETPHFGSDPFTNLLEHAHYQPKLQKRLLVWQQALPPAEASEAAPYRERWNHAKPVYYQPVPGLPLANYDRHPRAAKLIPATFDKDKDQYIGAAELSACDDRSIVEHLRASLDFDAIGGSRPFSDLRDRQRVPVADIAPMLVKLGPSRLAGLMTLYTRMVKAPQLERELKSISPMILSAANKDPQKAAHWMGLMMELQVLQFGEQAKLALEPWQDSLPKESRELVAKARAHARQAFNDVFFEGNRKEPASAPDPFLAPKVKSPVKFL